MGILSTLLGSRDNRGGARPHRPVCLRAAAPAEVETAVKLVLAGPNGQISQGHLRDFLAFINSRQSAMENLWIAEQDGKILQSLLGVNNPGRTILLLSPPQPEAGPSEHLLKSLVDSLCRTAAAQGVHLAQALLDPQDAVTQRAFYGSGFRLMAELIYLQTEIRSALPGPQLHAGDQWVNYSPSTHELFRRAIQATYQDSLDCPALNGMRDIEDVIEGHKVAGEFDPGLWFVLVRGDNPIGVLLLAISRRHDQMELVYLGLAPEARGKQIGALLMRQALTLAFQHKRARLTLAVDARNVPAIKLYYRHGLARLTTKHALMFDLRTLVAAPAASPSSCPHLVR